MKNNIPSSATSLNIKDFFFDTKKKKSVRKP